MQALARLSICTCAVIAVSLAGCSRKQETPTPSPAVSPTPGVAKAQQTPSTPTKSKPYRPQQLSSAPSTPPASAPAQPVEVSDATPSPQQIAELERQYMTDTEGDKKVDIIFELSDMDTPGAYQALARLLMAEKEPETRSQLLMAIGDSTMPDEQKLTIVSQYVGPEQPQEVREMAIEALDDIEDPRTMPVWQRLAADKDENIRETAKAAIERLKNPSAE